MAFENINAFIAESWLILVKQVGVDLNASLSNWRLKPGDDSSLRIGNSEFTVGSLGAPGIVASTEAGDIQTLQIRFPETDSCSFEVSGTLEGDTGIPLVGSVQPGQIDLKVSAFSVLAEVSIDHGSAAAPLLTELALMPTIAIDSDLLQLSIAQDHWTATEGSPHKGAIQAPVTIRTGGLFPHLGNIEVNGTIFMDLLSSPWLRAEVNILHVTNVPVTISNSLPPGLQAIVDSIKVSPSGGVASNIPRKWGVPPPGFVEPVIASPPWPSQIDFTVAAGDVASSTAKSHVLDGIVFNSIYSWDPGTLTFTLTSYDDGRDSAIWTGHLLSAHAFRYAAAEKPSGAADAALADAGTILSGIERLFAVPQKAVTLKPDPPLVPESVSGLLCRSVFSTSRKPTATPPFNNPDAANKPGEPSKVGNYYNAPIDLPDGSAWYAFGRGGDEPSRDQLIGIITGLGWAATFFADDDATMQRVRALLSDVVDYLVSNGWGYPSPTGDLAFKPTRFSTLTTFITEFHQQLAILKIAAVVLGGDYATKYDDAWTAVSDWTWLPVWIDTFDPIDKYYKFNLDWDCLGILLYLETDIDRRAPLINALTILRIATQHHRNAFFNLLWLAAQLPADRSAALVGASGFNPAQTLQEETTDLLLQWLQRRTQVWGPNMLPTQATAVVAHDWLGSTFMNPNYRSLLQPYVTSSDGSSRFAATYALPVTMRPGSDMDYLWQRDPFSTSLAPDGTGKLSASWGDRDKEGPGIDFLLPYWMAKYFGVVGQ